MNKLFFLTATLCLLWASCSSDQPFLDPTGGGTPEAKIPVTINVVSDSEFSQLRSVSPSDAGVESMFYLVYDEASGDYIKHKLITGEDMGLIKDTLAAGSYRIAFFAATYNMTIDNMLNGGGYDFDFETYRVADVNFSSASYVPSYGLNEDFFYTDFVLTVSKASAQESVRLERITSKLEIVPTDIASIPDDITDVSFCFKGLEAQFYTFNDKSCNNYYREVSDFYPYPGYPKFISNFWVRMTREQLMNVNADNPITLLILPVSSPIINPNYPDHNKEMPITAIFYTQPGIDSYPDRVIKTEYTLERNKILRLTGKLFADETNSEVSIDDEWDADITEGNFD